jgi:mRNA interferase HigB
MIVTILVKVILSLVFVNIYNRSTLVAFYAKHPDCRQTLEKWYHDVKAKRWRKPGDVTADFNKARTIKNNRAIFEINWNDYRMVVEINYVKQWVFIKFIGTHAEYDEINPETVNLYPPKKKKT